MGHCLAWFTKYTRSFRSFNTGLTWALDLAVQRNGSCALHLACKDGRYAAAKLLVDRGASVDVQDRAVSSLLLLQCSDIDLY